MTKQNQSILQPKQEHHSEYQTAMEELRLAVSFVNEVACQYIDKTSTCCKPAPPIAIPAEKPPCDILLSSPLVDDLRSITKKLDEIRLLIINANKHCTL